MRTLEQVMAEHDHGDYGDPAIVANSLHSRICTELDHLMPLLEDLAVASMASPVEQRNVTAGCVHDKLLETVAVLEAASATADLDRPLSDRALYESYVRDPDEAYAIFQESCHDRGLSAERVIVGCLDKLALRVAVIEEACAGQIRDHEISQAIGDLPA